MPDSRPILEELTRRECVDLLGTEPVGRLAVTVGALPAVFPVNYAIRGEDVVFRCAPGTKFFAATSSAVVAFQVDSYEPRTHEGWSVLVQGMAEEITEPHELRQLDGLELESWGLGDVADRFVKVSTTVVTGRRIRRVDRAQVMAVHDPGSASGGPEKG